MKREEVQRRTFPGEPQRLVVTQSNDLAGSIQDMSLAEKRLVLLAAAVIRQADTELPSVRFDVSDYRRIYNVVNNNLVSELLELVSTITTRNIVLPHGKNSRTSFSVVNMFTVVSGPDSETGRAYAVIEMHRDMARFFLGLDGNFFSMPLLVYSTYRSNYALRMGEILASGNRGTRNYKVTFTTEDLKARLDCKHYTNFAQFRRRVLEPAKKENDEIGYLTFDWEEHKSGRTIERLTFDVTLRRDAWSAEQQRTDVTRIAFENKLRKLGFDQVPAEYYQALGVERLQELTDEVVGYVKERERTSDPIRNAGAYLRTRVLGEVERVRADETRPVEAPTSTEGNAIRQLRSSQERFQLADELTVMLSNARNEYALSTFDKLEPQEQERLLSEVVADVLSPTPTLIGPHQRPVDAQTIPAVTQRMAVIRLLERRKIIFYGGPLATPEAFADSKKLLLDLREADRASVIRAAMETEAG